MKVENQPINKLIPYEFNNRNHDQQQVDRIANSIKEFGFNQPIVIDESNIILVGHGRLAAAQKLGLKEVPVLKLDNLSETQKKAYRILDNKLQNDSTWSFNNLELELGFLEDEGFDLGAWGLDELRNIFPEDEPEVTDDEFNPDECENTETFIKLGDLIELGEHRLLCGDSTDAEQVAELFAGETAVLLITDPPYGVDYDPEWRSEYDGDLGTRARGKVENDHRADWLDTYKLFNAQVAYVWHADLHARTVQNNLEDAGYKLISQIIWAKQHFVFSRGDYHWQHEPCWYAVKEGKTHNFTEDRTQSTLWQISNNNAFSKEKEERTGHGTQKPIECMARPIRNNSKKGELVCDPFLGSGTTLIAADQLNRICYGMEISPKYCHVIIERYYKHCKKNNKPFKCLINGNEYTPELSNI